MQFSYSQNYQTVEEVDTICSQLGFASDEDAQLAVDRILKQIGLPSKGFTLKSCPNINNAVAKNIKGSNGKYHRYILYDNQFMSRIENSANTDWSAISILAHEIGHHLIGHSLNNEGSNHTYELEADYWSGWALAKLGASLTEAQSAIQSLRYEKATSTHPAKKDRLLEIEKGWDDGGGIINQMELGIYSQAQLESKGFRFSGENREMVTINGEYGPVKIEAFIGSESNTDDFMYKKEKLDLSNYKGGFIKNGFLNGLVLLEANGTQKIEKQNILLYFVNGKVAYPYIDTYIDGSNPSNFLGVQEGNVSYGCIYIGNWSNEDKDICKELKQIYGDDIFSSDFINNFGKGNIDTKLIEAQFKDFIRSINQIPLDSWNKK